MLFSGDLQTFFDIYKSWCKATALQKRSENGFKMGPSDKTEWLILNSLCRLWSLASWHKEVNHIRCWDEWTPANELWQDPSGSFELAIGSVSALSGEGASAVVTLWNGHQAVAPALLSANVSVSKWDWHRPGTYPAVALWNQRPLKWTSACVQSAPRHPVGSTGSKCGLPPEDLLDTGRSVRLCPCPPTPWPSNHHHRPDQAAHWQPLADQGADHPGLVSNPCLHLP